MNNKLKREPIPWVHKINPLVTSWTWETEHFIVVIYAEGLSEKKMYHWKISDKSSGQPVPFDSNQEVSFNACVDSVLEVIGKSYNRRLGYLAYAGDLATTFIIHDGRKLDLSPIVGQQVVVTLLDPDTNLEVQINGMFDIENYDAIVKTDEMSEARIAPISIIDIHKEFSSGSVLDSLTNQVKTSRAGRIIYEEWKKGCTGRPGFNPGTVEHSPGDKYCPIHNL